MLGSNLNEGCYWVSRVPLPPSLVVKEGAVGSRGSSSRPAPSADNIFQGKGFQGKSPRLYQGTGKTGHVFAVSRGSTYLTCGKRRNHGPRAPRDPLSRPPEYRDKKRQSVKRIPGPTKPVNSGFGRMQSGSCVFPIPGLMPSLRIARDDRSEQIG